MNKMKKGLMNTIYILFGSFILVVLIYIVFNYTPIFKQKVELYDVKLRGYELNPEFNPNNYEYTAVVSENTVEISCESDKDLRDCNKSINLSGKSEYTHEIEVFDGLGLLDFFFGIVDDLFEVAALPVEGFSVKEHIERFAGIIESDNGHASCVRDSGKEGFYRPLRVISEPTFHQFGAAECGEVRGFHSRQLGEGNLRLYENSLAEVLVFGGGEEILQLDRVRQERRSTQGLYRFVVLHRKLRNDLIAARKAGKGLGDCVQEILID